MEMVNFTIYGRPCTWPWDVKCSLLVMVTKRRGEDENKNKFFEHIFPKIYIINQF